MITQPRTISNVEIWHKRLWKKSMERSERHPLWPIFSFFLTTTCTIEYNPRNAERAEKAVLRFGERVARETGTHISMVYAVAATKALHLHVHVVLGADPNVIMKGGAEEAFRPRRVLDRLQNHPVFRKPTAIKGSEEAIAYLSGAKVAELHDVGCPAMQAGHNVELLIPYGWLTDGYTAGSDGRDLVDANDYAPAEYVLNQATVAGLAPITSLAAFCPGRFARLRSCQRDSCALGFVRERY